MGAREVYYGSTLDTWGGSRHRHLDRGGHRGPSQCGRVHVLERQRAADQRRRRRDALPVQHRGVGGDRRGDARDRAAYRRDPRLTGRRRRATGLARCEPGCDAHVGRRRHSLHQRRQPHLR